MPRKLREGLRSDVAHAQQPADAVWSGREKGKGGPPTLTDGCGLNELPRSFISRTTLACRPMFPYRAILRRWAGGLMAYTVDSRWRRC